MSFIRHFTASKINPGFNELDLRSAIRVLNRNCFKCLDCFLSSFWKNGALQMAFINWIIFNGYKFAILAYVIFKCYRTNVSLYINASLFFIPIIVSQWPQDYSINIVCTKRKCLKPFENIYAIFLLFV